MHIKHYFAVSHMPPESEGPELGLIVPDYKQLQYLLSDIRRPENTVLDHLDRVMTGEKQEDVVTFDNMMRAII